jgi:23S rRNA pseudouridine2605 synthase
MAGKPIKPKTPKIEEVFRLNKFVAHCGICSRRKAAELVKAKKVKVNGKIEDNPAYLVQPTDKIMYEGKVIRPERKKVYILMNKPKNVVTTTSDERARKTIMDIITPKVKERVYPVGRLDRNTTGLLLITNDGDLAKKLSHPSHKIQKIYQVELDKEVSSEDLKKIKSGLTLEDGPAEVDMVRHVDNKPNNIVQIEIHMGKNRIVRRIFEHLSYEVVRLDRIYYAGLTKKDLPRGWFRPLKQKEIIMLKHFT